MSLRSALLESLGVAHGFAVASEGDYRTQPLPPGVALARQVHGTHLIWPDAPGRGEREADAVAGRAGEGAGVLTADCVPILLVDPEADLIAAVHAGWRGTQADIVGSAVAALIAAGAEPARIHAALGPCIRACCYEVGTELASDFIRLFGEHIVTSERHLDLAAANVQRLGARGISRSQIEELQECTACARDADGPRFFSHRRDQTPRRQLSWIVAPTRASQLLGGAAR